MPQPSPTRTDPSTAIRLARHWGMAAVLGHAVAVTIAVEQPLPGLSPSIGALLAIAIGWIVTFAFAPWRSMLAVDARRRRAMRLATEIARIGNGEGERALPDDLVRGRDEIAGLARNLNETLAQAVAHRRESRLLQRRMDDTIRRETDRATSRLRREAETDPLTGLGNRRSLDQTLDQLFGHERRRGRDSVVAMVIDIDLFKPVNDTLGHSVGDECLTFLATLLVSTLRREDSAIRMGGDEFVVLMPNITLEEGTAVAERLRALFSQMPWPHHPLPRPTLSIGLSRAACRNAQARDDLLPRADEALYRAKASGRNTVRSVEAPVGGDSRHRAAT